MSLVGIQFSRLWLAYDSDGDELLTKNEFIEFMQSKSISRWFHGIQISEDILDNIFESISRNGFACFQDFYKIVEIDKCQTRVHLKMTFTQEDFI